MSATVESVENSDPLAALRTVLVVSEMPLVRMGLVHLLQSEGGFRVCGQCETADQARQAVSELRPDFAIVDLSLRANLGLGLVEELKRELPDVRILVTSTHEDSLFAGMALRAGATGFVNKNVSPVEIMQGLRQLAVGRIFVSPHIAHEMLGQVAGKTSGESTNLFSSLSERELATFELIGKGWTTRRIARQLDISVHTVETYRERLRSKLGIKNSAELTFRAIVWVLLNG